MRKQNLQELGIRIAVIAALSGTACIVSTFIGSGQEQMPTRAFGLELGQVIEESDQTMEDYTVPSPMPFYETYAISTLGNGQLYKIEAKSKIMPTKKCIELVRDMHLSLKSKYEGAKVSSKASYSVGRVKISNSHVDIALNCLKGKSQRESYSMISYEDPSLAEMAKAEIAKNEEINRPEKLKEQGILVDFL